MVWAQDRWPWVWSSVLGCESLMLPAYCFPWGLQEADLEWTTVKQSFLTEVEQLSR